MPMSESALKAVEPTVNTNIAKAIKGIGQEMNKEGVADVFKWFIFMSTDVIGELAFAESFRMLDQAKVSTGQRAKSPVLRQNVLISPPLAQPIL